MIGAINPKGPDIYLLCMLYVFQQLFMDNTIISLNHKPAL